MTRSSSPSPGARSSLCSRVVLPWTRRVRLVELLELDRPATSGGTQFQARLNLAKCFRAHGINVPDPSAAAAAPAGGGGLFRLAAELLAGADQPRPVRPASSTSPRRSRELNLSPAQRAQFQQQTREVRPVHALARGQHPRSDDQRRRRLRLPPARSARSIATAPRSRRPARRAQSLRPRFGRGGAGRGGVRPCPRSGHRRRGRCAAPRADAPSLAAVGAIARASRRSPRS